MEKKLKEIKKARREQTLKKREELYKTDPAMHAKFSAKITETLKGTSEYKNAGTVMCFVSFGDEVETHEFIKDMIKHGKRVCVPYIVKGKKIMVPAEISDFDNDLKPGYYGILAPTEETLNILPNDQVDLVITPGVIFDKKGYRIGYGAGFYDKFFASLSKPVPKIAIAFSLQLAVEVPRDEYDIPVDKLITEKGIVYFNHEDK